MSDDGIAKATQRALEGNLATGAEKLAGQHKLFVRERLALLLDEGSLVEDALLANANAPTDDLPADGVVTGRGTVDGRPVCVVANDTTVKAGSWGARTVEKLVPTARPSDAHSTHARGATVSSTGQSKRRCTLVVGIR